MRASLQAVALWGRAAPAHSITAVMITDDQQTLVTGSREGQLCLWDLSSELKISSKEMLFGHTASVTCLAKAREFEKQPYVVSATENGEMCVWNVTSGQCIENAKLPYRHTAIYYYHCSSRVPGEGWLLCCGEYRDVLVIDAKTLSVLHTLSSQSSDWISCMCIVHSARIQEDSLVAVSVTGVLKVWDLSSSVNSIQERSSVGERESRALGCVSCRAVRFCAYTERLLLVVSPACWQVYDYCDFSLLCAEPCERGRRFAGGELLAARRLVVWTEDGHGYIYQLPSRWAGLGNSHAEFSGLSKSTYPADAGALKEAGHPRLLCFTALGEDKNPCQVHLGEVCSCSFLLLTAAGSWKALWLHTPVKPDGFKFQSFPFVMGFMNERKEPFYKVLFSAEASGRITLWHVPDVPVSTFDGPPKEIPIATTWTLQDNFDKHRSMSESLIDHLCATDNGLGSVVVSSSVYIPSLDRLVCGCENGDIFVTPGLKTARARLLENRPVLKDNLPYKVLSGHSGRVTCLLYPHDQSVRFDPSWLLSGGQDSVVICWDVFAGGVLHRFSLQAGPVTELLRAPESYRFRDASVVCCVCSDHSVAVLHLQKRACLLHARKHLFPVKIIKFDPVENLLIVGCEDESVYIWEVETGTLERHETGGTARAILARVGDPGRRAAGAFLPAPPQPKTSRHAGHQPSSSYQRGVACHGAAPAQRSADELPDTACIQQPFAIVPVQTKWNNANFHVLLFDLEKLEDVLLASELSGRRASNSFHSCDTLGRARSATEKRALTLKRNKPAGSAPAAAGPGDPGRSEPACGADSTAGPLDESGAGKRQKKMKSSRKIRMQPSGSVDVNVAIDTAKLLLSCLLPWGVDKEIDNLCVRSLGFLRLQHPVTFGLVSGENHLSLMLPGWKRHRAALEEQAVINLFSTRVLDLANKYLAATDGQTGKKDGHERNADGTRGLETVFLLSRIALINRIINMPSEVTGEAASPQKSESVHDKRQNTEALIPSFPSFHGELSSSGGRYRSPGLGSSSLFKLVRCWSDQSVKVAEALQAALLAEARSSAVAPRDTPGGGQPGARSGSASALKRDRSSNAANLPDVEDVPDRCVLEEPESPDDMKPHPWISKVCSCKVC